ncbi:MAG: hypothetical protein Kow00107_05780 [Planctomycetota bacterium]
MIRHADFAARDAIVREIGISPYVASVMVNRGIRTPDEARRFLSPSLLDIHDPFLMKDMDLAADRLAQAVIGREKIVVFGDYDVDGIAASIVVRDFIQSIGVTCECHIPDRLTEGYGLNDEAVREYAARGFNLMITVDCGVKAVETVALARSLGMDVIVTDHHETGEELPPANAVVDPMRADCSYPFKRLAGVGVAYKLIWALSTRLSGGPKVYEGFRKYLIDALPIVALGTVCDVVPLLGENRVLVKHGLEGMAKCSNIGLMSLMEEAGILSRLSRDNRAVSVRDVAFSLGPRINAAGRMGSADTALALLSSTDSSKCWELSKKLADFNKQRQELEADMLQQAVADVRALPAIPSAIMLAREEWHQGVLGIVASRVVGHFYRPTFLAVNEGEVTRGSARSIEGFDIVKCLTASESLLEHFGGHAGAAGFTVRTENLDKLREEVNRYADAVFAENPKLLVPVVTIEAELPFRAINPQFVHQLHQLEPFGHEHERPLFCAMGVSVAGEPRLVGANNQHIVMMLNHEGTSFRSIAFNRPCNLSAISSRINVLFYPKLDNYLGVPNVQLEIVDFRNAN